MFLGKTHIITLLSGLQYYQPSNSYVTVYIFLVDRSLANCRSGVLSSTTIVGGHFVVFSFTLFVLGRRSLIYRSDRLRCKHSLCPRVFYCRIGLANLHFVLRDASITL